MSIDSESALLSMSELREFAKKPDQSASRNSDLLAQFKHKPERPAKAQLSPFRHLWLIVVPGLLNQAILYGTVCKALLHTMWVYGNIHFRSTPVTLQIY